MIKFLKNIKTIEIYTAINFTIMICTIILIGFVFKIKDVPYCVLVQMLAISLISAALEWIAFSDDVFKHLAYIWRIGLFMIPFLAVLIGFAMEFNWFPATDTKAWLMFIAIFLFCLIGCIICFEVYYRITGNKYNKLLKDYKKNQEHK